MFLHKRSSLKDGTTGSSLQEWEPSLTTEDSSSLFCDLFGFAMNDRDSTPAYLIINMWMYFLILLKTTSCLFHKLLLGPEPQRGSVQFWSRLTWEVTTHQVGGRSHVQIGSFLQKINEKNPHFLLSLCFLCKYLYNSSAENCRCCKFSLVILLLRGQTVWEPLLWSSSNKAKPPPRPL